MFLQNVKSGTKFTIVFEDKKRFQAEYLGDLVHVNFRVLSPEIAENIEQYKNAKVTVELFLHDLNYEFTGQILGLKQGMKDVVNCKAASLFKEVHRRVNTRINVNLKVKVYDYSDDPKKLHRGEFICEAVSEDLSKGGVRVWADYDLDAPLNTIFTLEISMPLGTSHILSAKLVRNQQNTASRAYNYDYGFIFLSQDKDRQEKLILDIVESRMRKM